MSESAAQRLCERCEMRAWDEMWSPDGLGGHEILVCHPCWQELDQEAKLMLWHTLHD